MKKDYAKTADTLIAALGGKDNITRLFHCMTRLRFYVKDRSKINEKEILKLSEISGVNWHEDQFQVIAGNEVNAVYKALETKAFLPMMHRQRTLTAQRVLFQKLSMPSPDV